MIQRIQTLWLLLAAVCMGLAFQFKFAAGTKVENNQSLVTNVTNSTHIITLLLGFLFIGLSVFTLISYKNRKRQMQLSVLNIVLGLANIYFLYWQTNKLTNTTYALGAVIPVFAIGFTISALRCIWQDEKTIQDLNSSRLR